MPAEILTVDWVHPSVRDTIIEYLMTHDSYREKFLATAKASGAVMALSTAGGTHGTLDRPLLRNGADWSALEKTAKRIGLGSDFNEQFILLQGMEEAIWSSRSKETEYRLVRALTIALLQATQSTWGEKVKGVTVRALQLYYSLSVQVDYLVASPNLFPVWRGATLLLKSALNTEISARGLDRADEWIELAKLLLENEPRFLRMHISDSEKTPQEEINETLGEVVRWIDTWSENLEDLDEDESQWVEDSGDLVQIPIEPNSDESHEAFRLKQAIEVVDSAIGLSDDLAEAGDKLIVRMQQQREVRGYRQARWDDWDEEQAQRAFPAPDLASDDKVRRFNIADFFSDL